MYAVDSAASQPNAVAASPSTPGPSSATESNVTGTGTTSADQTVRGSPPVTPEARETTLPMAHDSAASRHKASASSGT